MGQQTVRIASSCGLIESGSNDNRLVKNDCTHGGDGIFVRVLNGWCSTGNHFEGNDCSHANNNCVECWSPRNTFIGNKANHGSYGFWMGGSDKSVLIGNAVRDVQDDGGVTRLTQGRSLGLRPEALGTESQATKPPQANLKVAASVAELARVQTEVRQVGAPEVSPLQLPMREGAKIEFDALGSRDPTGHALQFQWDFGDGAIASGAAKVQHTYSTPGFRRVGLTVSNGALSDLAWRDLYVVRDVDEIGTEGQAPGN